MSEDREMTLTEKWEKERQEKLQKDMEKQVKFMKGLIWTVKYLVCLGTFLGGFCCFYVTNAAFGDVLMLIGAVCFYHLLMGDD